MAPHAPEGDLTIGRSFGVIAAEIRSLSDEANLFTDRLVASLKGS
ncbi:hypothetical protein [Pelagibacterium xiamenense]|nr:hypothetical protein [Pelagibacterium xiamenense]